jgi:hypothetical protein
MSTTAEIVAFMAIDFPQCNSTIEEIGQQSATVRHKIGHAVGTYSVPPAK